MLPSAFSLVILFCDLAVFSLALDGQNLSEQIKADLRRLNLSCDSHFCDRYASLEFATFPSCSCEDDCAFYDNCCVDASGFSERRSLQDDPPECLPFPEANLFTKSKCRSNYTMHHTKDLCERSTLKNILIDHSKRGDSFSYTDGEHIVKDPLLITPVFSLASKMNYVNIFCATCNDEVNTDLTFWKIDYNCNNEEHSGKYLEDRDMTDENLILDTKPKHSFTKYNATEHKQCKLSFETTDGIWHQHLKCVRSINKCSSSFSGDQNVVDFCGKYTAYVFDDRGRIYRNPHCALCNGVDSLCVGPRRSYSPAIKGLSQLSFSVLLDFSGKGQVGTEVISGNCSIDQVWDPFKKVCRSLFCSSDYTLYEGRCRKDDVPDNSTSSSIGNSTEESNKLISCPKIYLSSELFEMMDNGTVVIEIYKDLILQRGEYQIINRSTGDSDQREFGQKIGFCAPNFNKHSKFSSALSYLTIVCLLVSIISLGIHLFASVVLSELHDVPGVNLASLSVCLLAFYIGFLVSPTGLGHPSSCRILAVCNYVLYLAAFCWMNVMAFDVFFSLRMASRQLRLMSEDGRGRYLLYLTYVTLVVLLLTTLTVLADLGELPGLPEQLVPRFGQDLSVCWFGNRPALLVFVAVPVLLILLANVVLFIATVSIIRETRSSTVSHSCSASVMNFRLYWRLSLMMGLSWLLSLLNGWLDIDYLHYITTIINALQGFFIFVSFTLNDKVRAKLMARLRRYNAVVSWSRDTTLKTGRPTSSSNTNTNTTSMASVSSTPGGRTSAKARDGVRDQSLVIECSHVDGDDGDDGVSGTTRL